MMVSAVVPCYNEAAGVAELTDRLAAALEPWAPDIEIILVDDGSGDATWQEIGRASDRHKAVRGIRLSANRGHQIALTAGLEVARGDRVLMLDADLQDPPELLPDMMAMMDTGYDVVYGVRLVRHGEGIAKRATAHLFYRFLNWLSDVPIPKDTGDFRLVNRRALDAVLAMPERSRFVRGMFAWVGFAQIGLTYERQPRRSGETKYDLAAMSRLAWDAITGFSSHPLRIAMRMAVFCGFLSVALILYVFTTFASGNTVPGWASIVTAVSFFSAIQLFVLAVIGEYLGRIYIEEKARPLYFVSGRVGFAKKPMN